VFNLPGADVSIILTGRMVQCFQRLSAYFLLFDNREFNDREQGNWSSKQVNSLGLSENWVDPVCARLRQALAKHCSPYCRACIHFQASSICIVRSERAGRQPRSAGARLASPIRTGGSPGRRQAGSCGTTRPHTFSAAAMTSLTEKPRAFARLSAPLSPPLSRCPSAFTCAD
jgi:hypothetical protein